MIALMCFLFAGAFAAPYGQPEFVVRTLKSAPNSLGKFVTLTFPTVRFLEAPNVNIPITKFSHVIDPKAGQYTVDFKAANGISSQESGFLKSVPIAARVLNSVDSYGNYGYGGETRIQEVDSVVQAKSGQTSWCSPEGIGYTLTYTADESGYHPIITKGQCLVGTRTIVSDPVAPVNTPYVSNSYSAPVEARTIVSDNNAVPVTTTRIVGDNYAPQ